MTSYTPHSTSQRPSPYSVHAIPPTHHIPSEHFSSLSQLLSSTTVSNITTDSQDTALVGYTTLIHHLLSTNRDVLVTFLEEQLPFHGEFSIHDNLRFECFDIAYEASKTTVLVSLCLYFALSSLQTIDLQIERYQEQLLSDNELFEMSLPRFNLDLTIPYIHKLDQYRSHLRSSLMMLLFTTTLNEQQQMKYRYYYDIYALYLNSYLDQLKQGSGGELPKIKHAPSQDIFLPQIPSQTPPTSAQPLDLSDFDTSDISLLDQSALTGSIQDDQPTLTQEDIDILTTLRALFTDHVTMDIIHNQPLFFATDHQSVVKTCVSFLSSQRLLASLPPLHYPQCQHWFDKNIPHDVEMYTTFDPKKLHLLQLSEEQVPPSELVQKASIPAPHHTLSRLFSPSALETCAQFSFTVYNHNIQIAKANKPHHQHNQLSNPVIVPITARSRTSVKTLLQLLWYAFSRWHLPFNLNPTSLYLHYHTIRSTYNKLNLRRVDATPSLYQCIGDYVNVFKFLSIHLNLALTRYPSIRHEYHSYNESIKHNKSPNGDSFPLSHENSNPPSGNMIDPNEIFANKEPPKYHSHFITPNINNFTHDLSDGVILCLIIHHYFPSLIPLSAIRYLSPNGHNLPITQYTDPPPISITISSHLTTATNRKSQHYIQQQQSQIQEQLAEQRQNAMGQVIVNNFSLLNHAVSLIGSIPPILHPELGLNSLKYLYHDSQPGHGSYDQDLLKLIEKNRQIHTVFNLYSFHVIVHPTETAFSFPQLDLHQHHLNNNPIPAATTTASTNTIKSVDLSSYGTHYSLNEQMSIIFLSFLFQRLIQIYPVLKAVRRCENALEGKVLKKKLLEIRAKRYAKTRQRAKALGLPPWCTIDQINQYEQVAKIDGANLQEALERLSISMYDPGSNTQTGPNSDLMNTTYDLENDESEQTRAHMFKLKQQLKAKHEHFQHEVDEFNQTLHDITGLNVSQVFQQNQGDITSILVNSDDDGSEENSSNHSRAQNQHDFNYPEDENNALNTSAFDVFNPHHMRQQQEYFQSKHQNNNHRHGHQPSHHSSNSSQYGHFDTFTTNDQSHAATTQPNPPSNQSHSNYSSSPHLSADSNFSPATNQSNTTHHHYNENIHNHNQHNLHPTPFTNNSRNTTPSLSNQSYPQFPNSPLTATTTSSSDSQHFNNNHTLLSQPSLSTGALPGAVDQHSTHIKRLILAAVQEHQKPPEKSLEEQIMAQKAQEEEENYSSYLHSQHNLHSVHSQHASQQSVDTYTRRDYSTPQINGTQTQQSRIPTPTLNIPAIQTPQFNTATNFHKQSPSSQSANTQDPRYNTQTNTNSPQTHHTPQLSTPAVHNNASPAFLHNSTPTPSVGRKFTPIITLTQSTARANINQVGSPLSSTSSQNTPIGTINTNHVYSQQNTQNTPQVGQASAANLNLSLQKQSPFQYAPQFPHTVLQSNQTSPSLSRPPTHHNNQTSTPSLPQTSQQSPNNHSSPSDPYNNWASHAEQRAKAKTKLHPQFASPQPIHHQYRISPALMSTNVQSFHHRYQNHLQLQEQRAIEKQQQEIMEAEYTRRAELFTELRHRLWFSKLNTAATKIQRWWRNNPDVQINRKIKQAQYDKSVRDAIRTGTTLPPIDRQTVPCYPHPPPLTPEFIEMEEQTILHRIPFKEQLLRQVEIEQTTIAQHYTNLLQQSHQCGTELQKHNIISFVNLSPGEQKKRSQDLDALKFQLACVHSELADIWNNKLISLTRQALTTKGLSPQINISYVVEHSQTSAEVKQAFAPQLQQQFAENQASYMFKSPFLPASGSSLTTGANGSKSYQTNQHSPIPPTPVTSTTSGTPVIAGVEYVRDTGKSSNATFPSPTTWTSKAADRTKTAQITPLTPAFSTSSASPRPLHSQTMDSVLETPNVSQKSNKSPYIPHSAQTQAQSQPIASNRTSPSSSTNSSQRFESKLKSRYNSPIVGDHNDGENSNNFSTSPPSQSPFVPVQSISSRHQATYDRLRNAQNTAVNTNFTSIHFSKRSTGAQSEFHGHQQTNANQQVKPKANTYIVDELLSPVLPKSHKTPHRQNKTIEPLTPGTPHHHHHQGLDGKTECDNDCSFIRTLEDFPMNAETKRVVMQLDRHIHSMMPFSQQRTQQQQQQQQQRDYQTNTTQSSDSNRSSPHLSTELRYNNNNRGSYNTSYSPTLSSNSPISQHNQQSNYHNYDPQHNFSHNHRTHVQTGQNNPSPSQSQTNNGHVQDHQFQELEAVLEHNLHELISCLDITQLVQLVKSISHSLRIHKDFVVKYLIQSKGLYIILSRMKDCQRVDEHATFVIHSLLLFRHIIYSGLPIEVISPVFFAHEIHPSYIDFLNQTQGGAGEHSHSDILNFSDVLLDIMTTFRDIPDIFITCVSMLQFGALYIQFNPLSQNDETFVDELRKPQVVSIIQSLYRLGKDMIQGLADNRNHSTYLLTELSTAEIFFSHLGPDTRPPQEYQMSQDDYENTSFSFTPRKRMSLFKKGHNPHPLSPQSLDPEMLLIDSPYLHQRHQRDQNSKQSPFGTSPTLNALKNWRDQGDVTANPQLTALRRKECLDTYFRILASLKQLMDVVPIHEM